LVIIMHKLWSKLHLTKIMPVLNELSAPYAIIKGPALSQTLYNDPNVREYNDLDILISRDSIGKMKEILKRNGFQIPGYSKERELFCELYSHQLPTYTDSTGNLVYDINFDVTWGEFEGKRIQVKELLADTVSIDLFGFEVKTLSPVNTFIQLALHIFRDMNSIYLLATRKTINKAAFSDVYQLIVKYRNELPPEYLFEACKKYDIIPYAYYVLYYTGILFIDEILGDYIHLFRTAEGDHLLNRYGLCEKERKLWNCDIASRFKSTDTFSLISRDLTPSDLRKIEVNQSMFRGITNDTTDY